MAFCRLACNYRIYTNVRQGLCQTVQNLDINNINLGTCTQRNYKLKPKVEEEKAAGATSELKPLGIHFGQAQVNASGAIDVQGNWLPNAA